MLCFVSDITKYLPHKTVSSEQPYAGKKKKGGGETQSFGVEYGQFSKFQD